MTASNNGRSNAPPVPRPRAPVIDLSQSRPYREKSAPPASGFVTTIEGASLADLVQLECMRGLTRAVHVRANEKEGHLYFDQGQLVHAETTNLVGEEAAYQILSWETGSVEPSPSCWVHPNTIHVSWQGLLMTVAQRKDEAERKDRVTKMPGATTMISRPIPEKARAQVTAETERPSSSILRSVRLDSEGTVIEKHGDVSDFGDAAAYVIRLAELVGEGLGLDDLQGLECVTHKRVMLAYRDDETIVAIEALPQADITSHRKRAGT